MRRRIYWPLLPGLIVAVGNTFAWTPRPPFAVMGMNWLLGLCSLVLLFLMLWIPWRRGRWQHE